MSFGNNAFCDWRSRDEWSKLEIAISYPAVPGSQKHPTHTVDFYYFLRYLMAPYRVFGVEWGGGSLRLGFRVFTLVF